MKIDIPTIGFNITVSNGNKNVELRRIGETVENVRMTTNIERNGGIGIENFTQKFGYVRENPELDMRIHCREHIEGRKMQEQRNERERRERILATELEKLRATDDKGQANEILARNEIKDLVMETIIDSLR